MRGRTLPAAITTFAVVVAALLAHPLNRVWPLMFVVLATATLAYARRVGALLGAALAILSALIVILLAAYATPHAGWSFGTDFIIGATAFGLIHAAVLALPVETEGAFLDRRQWRDLADHPAAHPGAAVSGQPRAEGELSLAGLDLGPRQRQQPDHQQVVPGRRRPGHTRQRRPPPDHDPQQRLGVGGARRAVVRGPGAGLAGQWSRRAFWPPGHC